MIVLVVSKTFVRDPNHLRQNKPVLVSVNYKLYFKIIRERFDDYILQDQYEPDMGEIKLLALSYRPETKEFVFLDGLQDQPVVLEEDLLKSSEKEKTIQPNTSGRVWNCRENFTS